VLTYGYENRINVLDHGHVYVIDRMGSDQRVEQSARVSYQEGTRQTSDTRGLIRYLTRSRHTTPFESCVITIAMRLPIAIARQYIRHRMQSVSEESARYSLVRDQFYLPKVEDICFQSDDNKQGRADPIPTEDAELIRSAWLGSNQEEYERYHELLEMGLARETARFGLPLSTYTNWQTTINLHNLLHMIRLRVDPHAQKEAREYAEALALIVEDWTPLCWEAFVDYQLKSKTLSRMEWDLMKQVVDLEKLRGLLKEDTTMTKREKRELWLALEPKL
jgi:thymidylate synthase (FAD)